MKFKLLLSLITTLVYTNTFIASATELSDMKHSKSIFDENMQVNIEEKNNFRFERYSPKEWGTRNVK